MRLNAAVESTPTPSVRHIPIPPQRVARSYVCCTRRDRPPPQRTWSTTGLAHGGAERESVARRHHAMERAAARARPAAARALGLRRPGRRKG
eukprot:7062835-Prymnesium_polylepis.2